MLTIPNTLRDTNMQVALPAIEVNRMTQQFGLGTSALRAILAMLIMALSFASIFISVLDNIRARRHELALMRTMGGTSTLYRLLLLEGGLLGVAGTTLGLILSRVGMTVLAMAVENQFHYDLSSMGILSANGPLLGPRCWWVFWPLPSPPVEACDWTSAGP